MLLTFFHGNFSIGLSLYRQSGTVVQSRNLE
jgi:hypothetical protein